jgi:inner membrane protein
MDSLSQLVLGAGVGVAIMGRRTKVWKAALWGGVCGTLPDLDVFIDHGDPISNMTFHRTESHALLYLTAASPVIAASVARLHGEGDRFGRWWLALWLALVTHALLDTMTVYGTQIGLPVTDFPYVIGSVFIVDPLYTLPLLFGLIATGIDRGPRRLRWNLAGVVVSCVYLAWGVAAQQNTRNRALQAFASQRIAVERVLVTPTAFNSLLWRIVAIERGGGAYLEGYYSVLDAAARPLRFARFERGQALHARLADVWPVQRISWFSHGFWRVRERDGFATIGDLRMGQEPNYTFEFRVAARGADGLWREGDRADVGTRGEVRRGLAWIWARIFAADVEPLSRPPQSGAGESRK